MNNHDLDYYIKNKQIGACFNKDMSAYMSLETYEKGEDILSAGDLMTHFYFVVEGQVKIYKTLENGKSLLIRMPKAMTELGSLEFIYKQRLVDSCVQALTKTLVIKIPFSDLEKHTQKDIVFYKYLVKSLSHKLKTASNAASINITYPFKNRLASYLISVYNASKPLDIEDIKIEKMTDLAHFLGTSYRHLNRVVNELEQEQIIKKEKRSFIILNYEKLNDLAGGFYE